jgi:biotin carboxylase
VPRVLLILPTATYRAPDFLDAAAKLGVEVVVGSEHRQAMSDSMGDRAVTLTLSQPERAADQIERLAKRTPLDAIVAVDDGGTRAAAAAAKRLGLKGNAPEAVAKARDKAKMRRAFDEAGIPQPAWALSSHGDGGANAVGFPCVLKPLTRSGSQGVIRANTPGEAEAAAARIRTILGDDEAPLLAERFAEGEEVAVEGLLQAGELQTLAIFDKPDPLDGPYFEETIYVTPSRKPHESQREIERLTAQAAAALGLTEGPIHAELRLGPPARVLELAARSIGGLCGRSLRFGLGVSLEELILRHALGLPLDHIRREDLASGVMMLPIREHGVLQAVHGQEEARQTPHIAGLEISIAPGRSLTPLPEGDRYLGFMFAKAGTPEEVEQALRSAFARLRVEVSPAR